MANRSTYFLSMIFKFVTTVFLAASLSGCGVTDTAKDVFKSVGDKVSGIFSDDETGKPQELSTERILLRTSRGDLPLTLEIADKAEERTIGLMYRQSLSLGAGMLFVFPDEIQRSFWMKNTLIPLDIIFFSSKKKVVSVVENMLPCNEETTNQLCPLYYSGLPAMYALEVPAGFVAANGVTQGDELVR